MRIRKPAWLAVVVPAAEAVRAATTMPAVVVPVAVRRRNGRAPVPCVVVLALMHGADVSITRTGSCHP